MEESEDIVKNVKEIVTKFENSGQTSPKISPGKTAPKNKATGKKKVAALRRSIETSLRQEYQPQRFVASAGRPLADVKDELCKSMDLSQEAKVPSQNVPLSSQVRRNPFHFGRYNSTEVLSKSFVQDKDETLPKRFFPIPAPRNRASSKSRVDKRYKSSSDLATDDIPSSTTDESLSMSITNITENEGPLEQILEVSIVSSNLCSSEEHLDKTSELIGNETFLDTSQVLDISVIKSPPKIDTNMTEMSIYGQSKSSSETTKGKPCVKVSPIRQKEKKSDLNSSVYCCRLRQEDWDHIISSLMGSKDLLHNTYAKNPESCISRNEKSLKSNIPTSNFDSISDVLIIESSESILDAPTLIHSENNWPIESSHKETEMMSLLNDVNRDLSSMVATEELLKKLQGHNLEQATIKRFESLLKDFDHAINLLFLLNRMFCEELSQSKLSSLKEKLSEAKEIKKTIDLKCYRLLPKLETSIPRDVFDECLQVLTAKLVLKLKKECLTLKLSGKNKVSKSREKTMSYSMDV